MKVFLLLLSCFFTALCNAQTAAHNFKLPGNILSDVKYTTANGQNTYARYEKRVAVIELGDSVLYIERFHAGKRWLLNRYVMRNNKPVSSGWQKQYDAFGRLYAEKFYEEGKRKSTLYRAYSYYPGGQLMSDATYLSGKAQGFHFYYYKNGQMRECLEFDEDHLMNVQAYYDADGNPLDTGNFCDGEGILNIYSMYGKLIQQKIFHKGKVAHVKSITAE